MVNIKEISKLTSEYTVLYVEDNEPLALTVIEYLTKFFQKVVYAKDGQEGLLQYKQNKFDIVFTDIDMPNMNGLEMSAEIKKINKDQNIIIVSSYSDADMFVASATLGIDGYIIKPVNYDELNNMLYKLAKKLKSSEQNYFDGKEITELNNKILKQNRVIEELKETIANINKE